MYMAFLKLGYPVSFCHLWGILYSTTLFFPFKSGKKVKKIKIKINYENLISLYITEEKLNEGFFKLFFLVLLEVSYSKINIITMKLLFFLICS